MREYDEKTLDFACQTACNIVLRDVGESFDVDAVKSRVLHAWENPLRTVYTIAWTQDDVKRGLCTMSIMQRVLRWESTTNL